MRSRLPDPRGSRAVLIGTSSYDSPDLKPLLAVRNNLEVLSELLTADSGAFLPGRCTVVQDSSDPRGVCRTIREAAADAPDTLLVYFSGHGIHNHDYSELHLALSGTDQNDLRWTTVPFQAIREIFETAPCRNRILILDCCQSGWVLDSMMGDVGGGEEPLEIRGTYLLTSSSGDLKSFAPPTDRYTAFTGELIQLLRDGLPGGPELLPLSALFEPLAAALQARSMPSPRQQGSDGHAALALVRNRAVEGGDAAERPVAVKDGGPVPVTRLQPEVWRRRLLEWPVAASGMLGIGWVGVRFGPQDGETMEPLSPAGLVTGGAIAAMVLLFGTLGRVLPSGYTLIIGPDGIEVRYSKDQHFYYPWHRVSRVSIAVARGGRLRGTRYTLMLKPKPGVLVETAKRGAPGPRWDSRRGALRFAGLSHLDAPPAAVEKALARTAGSAWTPSNAPLGPPAPDEDTVAVFSAARGYFITIAVLSALFAYAAFPKDLLTGPLRLGLGLPSLALSVTACSVTWFAVSRIAHPVRLVISAAGVALSSAETEIVYAWSEIERIGVVSWPGGLDRLGLLALRPLNRATAPEPVDRSAFYLPRLTIGCVTVCTLPELAVDQRELHTALERFAGDGQLAPPGRDWLRPTRYEVPRVPRTSDEGTTFKGLRSKGTAMVLCAFLVAPLMALTFWADDREIPVLLAAFQSLVLANVPLFGLAAYFLTNRHRVALRIGAAGLTLTCSGLRARTLRVPWGDIESVGIIATQHPAVRHSLVMWLRPGARPPRFMWWPYRQEYGGLRLISIEGSRLDTTPEDLDRALAHHAGRRHARIQRLSHPGTGG